MTLEQLLQPLGSGGQGSATALGITFLARPRQSETVTRTAVDPAGSERVTRQSTRSTDDASGL